MTDDQQFILGLATLIVPTVASVLALWRTQATHAVVNGFAKTRERRARAAGRAQGRADAAVGDSPHKTEVIPPLGSGPMTERASRGP